MNKIAFIGAGSMTEAIISGIIQKKFIKSEQICVTNKNNQKRLQFLKGKYSISFEKNKEKVVKNADIILLSVKPNDLTSAIDSFKDFVHPDQLIVSVIAGVSTAEIEAQLNREIPVVRAMPNTSASVGYSTTAISKGRFSTKMHLEISTLLFDTIGITVIVDEKNMDIVTGISGSGPAYIYYLVEAMEEVAIENGLDRETAMILINQTIIGAGKMLEKSEISAEKLRENVMSPGGTTEAGIKTLSKYNFQKAIIECVKSATNRSAELGNR